MLDLFHARPDAWADSGPGASRWAPGAVLLRGFCLRAESEMLSALEASHRGGTVSSHGHPRRPSHVGGDDQLRLCRLGDGSDAATATTANDPATGRPWPPMPPVFRDVAIAAAAASGFEGFVPDACLDQPL